MVANRYRGGSAKSLGGRGRSRPSSWELRSGSRRPDVRLRMCRASCVSMLPLRTSRG
jgi:hypothetical protein